MIAPVAEAPTADMTIVWVSSTSGNRDPGNQVYHSTRKCPRVPASHPTPRMWLPEHRYCRFCHPFKVRRNAIILKFRNEHNWTILRIKRSLERQGISLSRMGIWKVLRQGPIE